MARLRPRPARWNTGMRTTTNEYPRDPATEVAVGDIVSLNGAGAIINNAGTENPTPLLGLAASASDDRAIDPDVINVEEFDPQTLFSFTGDRAPVATDRGKYYGITEDDDGIWYVDTTKIGADARVYVADVSLDRNEFYVRVRATNRQSPA